MPIIKEVREFFLRHTKVLTGVKRDREQPYPLQYTTTNALGELVTAYNRFLAGDIPSEDSFKKFLESITFKLNPEDTGTLTEQGLLSLATSGEVIAGTNTDINGFNLTIRPSDYKVIWDLVQALSSTVAGLANTSLKIRFYTAFPTTLLQGEKLGDLGIDINVLHSTCGMIAELTDVTPGSAVWTNKYNTNNVPDGGTIGQVLAKASANNYDTEWVTPVTPVLPILPSGTKLYLAHIGQVGTDAPTANIGINTIGAVVWSYSDVGIFWGTLAGAFPTTKTFVYALPFPGSTNVLVQGGAVIDPNKIVITSLGLGGAAANGMTIHLLIIVLP